jgi:hypothetical protein
MPTPPTGTFGASSLSTFRPSTSFAPTPSSSGISGGTLLGGASALASLAGGISSVIVGFRQARELEKQAIAEARRIRRAGNRILGAQTVAFAHAGVTQQGTPQDVRNDSLAEIERDVARSTQQFENAANRVRGEGILNLAAGISDAGTAAALTSMGKGGSTALFGRTPRAGLGAGLLGSGSP